jgi:diaminopimelate epimerase
MKLSKWQALGNAYLLAAPGDLAEPLTPQRARALCDGRADGILEVLSTDGAHAEVKVWNPDGSTAEMSGNGARIAAAWLARESGTGRVALRFGQREVTATVDDDAVVLDAGRVEVGETESVEIDGEQVELTPVSVGNPHAVVRRDPERAELLRLGPLLEQHPRFPGRTNVQLVRIDGTHDLTVGVWERGAGETLSSGTSSVAAAAAAIANGWCESPVTVHLAGGDLFVELESDGRARLTGPVEEVGDVELA